MSGDGSDLSARYANAHYAAMYRLVQRDVERAATGELWAKAFRESRTRAALAARLPYPDEHRECPT